MSHTDDEERRVAKQTADEISFDAHFDMKIVPLRKDLFVTLEAAVNSVDCALRVMRELESEGIFDVEYEGGSEFQRHLLEVRRLLTITQALMPTDANGEISTNKQLTDTVRALMSGTHLK